MLSAEEDVPLDLSVPSRRNTVCSDNESQKTISDLQSPLSIYGNPSSEWIPLKPEASISNNRISYPREFKLMVIDHYKENGQNKYRTCKKFQITKSMLNGWLSKIDMIRESRPGSLKTGRRPQFPEMEQQLFSLYSERLNIDGRVGNQWLRERTKELAGGTSEVCQLSERWLYNFKRKFRINLRHEKNSSAESCFKHSTSIENHSYSHIETNTLTDLSKSEEEIRKLVDGIVNQSDQLPIHAFYEKFPSLYRRRQVGQGRRGRKVQFHGVERTIHQCLIKKPNRGEPTANRWLQAQARNMATQFCPEKPDQTLKPHRCSFPSSGNLI
ncbi:unnamed protein product [Angiostrongylus costaricensis]|uniref:HTH CENPB-type domain-containing protein n=1 Tax=Angiostrongylus costaricensis TaxID=334426 RepID=A0A0R3PGB2_ANGCS|nr:unnamed protein product [Angiostrongylus costaricensis]